MRRFVIGDIHGCAKALRTLIEAIAPEPQDELVFLGDYVDRGPDSRNVVDQIIELQDHTQIVTLRGNHEIMLMGVALGGLDAKVWLENGGKATVSSYGGCLSKIPPGHLEFYQELVPYYETTDTIFVHAGYHHMLAMHQQDEATTYWTHLGYPLPMPHQSGKRVIVGHTPQGNGNVLDAGHVVCVDTYCFGGGYLTAFEVGSGEVIQADFHGHLRRPSLLRLSDRFAKVKSRLSGLLRSSNSPATRNGVASDPPGTTTSKVNGHKSGSKAGGEPTDTA